MVERMIYYFVGDVLYVQFFFPNFFYGRGAAPYVRHVYPNSSLLDSLFP